MNKDSFIRFLKNNHAFDEFKEEIMHCDEIEFSELVEEMGLDSEFKFYELIQDGFIFFYKRAITDISWQALHDKLKGEHDNESH